LNAPQGRGETGYAYLECQAGEISEIGFENLGERNQVLEIHLALAEFDQGDGALGDATGGPDG
jgi:hypothetical protein